MTMFNKCTRQLTAEASELGEPGVRGLDGMLSWFRDVDGSDGAGRWRDPYFACDAFSDACPFLSARFLPLSPIFKSMSVAFVPIE